jgi:hypothetical protein
MQGHERYKNETNHRKAYFDPASESRNERARRLRDESKGEGDATVAAQTGKVETPA